MILKMCHDHKVLDCQEGTLRMIAQISEIDLLLDEFENIFVKLLLFFLLLLPGLDLVKYVEFSHESLILHPRKACLMLHWGAILLIYVFNSIFYDVSTVFLVTLRQMIPLCVESFRNNSIILNDCVEKGLVSLIYRLSIVARNLFFVVELSIEVNGFSKSELFQDRKHVMLTQLVVASDVETEIGEFSPEYCASLYEFFQHLDVMVKGRAQEDAKVCVKK